MAISITYLDNHGKWVAERISDITYKSSYIGYRMFHNDYWIIPPSEKNLLFECGSDKRGFKKYLHCTTFYVKIRGYKKSRRCNPNYPERNTIYISPEKNGLTRAEYYSLCYRQAEERIRALATLASDGTNDFLPIRFSDFMECFSNAFFVDAFTIEKPDISYFSEAVNETISRLNEKLSGLEEYNALIYFRVPESVSENDFGNALEAIKSSVANLKFKVGLGFNGFNNCSADMVSVTVGISYRHSGHGVNR